MVGCVYFVVGMANLFIKFVEMEYLTMAYVLILSIPLWIPPVALWVGLKEIWGTSRRREKY